jgi:hypothetical protein
VRILRPHGKGQFRERLRFAHARLRSFPAAVILTRATSIVLPPSFVHRRTAAPPA